MIKKLLCVWLACAGASLTAMQQQETKRSRAAQQVSAATKMYKNLSFNRQKQVVLRNVSSDGNYKLVAKDKPREVHIFDKNNMKEPFYSLDLSNVHITSISRINVVEKTNMLIVVGHNGEHPVIIIDNPQQIDEILYYCIKDEKAINREIFDKNAVLEAQVSDDRQRCLVWDTWGKSVCVFECTGNGYILTVDKPERLLACDFFPVASDGKRYLRVTLWDGTKTSIDYEIDHRSEKVTVHGEYAGSDEEGQAELKRLVAERA